MTRLRDPRVLVTLLVLIYAGLSLVTLAAWSARGVYTVTGDEPHYLVMADGVIRHLSLELSIPYADEFASRSIFASGLAPAGTPPLAPYAHVLVGPHGLYSWHGPGISFLVAPGFALFGVLGAKLMMVALGGLAVVLAWRLSAVVMDDPVRRFFSVLVVAITFPLVPASTQVYPDLVAGILALAGVYFLLTVDRRRSGWSLAGYSFVIAYLPWLGTKYVITAGILLTAMAWREYRVRRSASSVVLLLAPAAVSFMLLVVYNVFAFGRISGPPAEGALELSRTSFMVLWGLLIDQDQGILLQNPVLWVGVFGLVAMVLRFRFVAIVWALVFASIWIPSAMHTGWYGLGSFVGRYSWALAILFILPSLVGMAVIAERSRRLFWVIVGLGLALHAAVFALTTFTGGSAPGYSAGIDLYTKPPETWLESYAIFWFPLQNWFPALYNVDWAYGFWPNAVWLLLGAAVLILALRPRWWRILVPAVAALVVVSGFAAVPGPRSDALPQSAAGGEAADYLTDGPVRQMRQGPYTWSVDYASAADAQTVVGKWELVQAARDAVVAAGELHGTDGAERTEEIPVPFFSLQPKEFVLRVATYGLAPMQVIQTGVRHG